VQIDRGADATDSLHTYGIDWKKNGIAWYIDGIKVHEVTSRSSPVPIPDEKMKIIMNVWSGSAVGWHGELSNEMLAGRETTTYYSRVSYDADGAPYGNQVAMSAPKTLPTFDTLGTRADDVLRGHGRADSINGRRGDDVVAGRGGRDVLTGGKGSDIVRGGGGDDTLVFIESRNRRADDVYVGSSGIDTLEIYCSFDKISGGKLLDEVDDLRAFMRTHYDVDRNGGPTFEFDSIGLSVRSVEDVEVILF
jgi:Ca2+-binding RTX toxin-like protein